MRLLPSGKHLPNHWRLFKDGEKREAVQLPFDEEHELSLSVRGADDAFRLEVSAEVSGCVWLLMVWLEDAAVALQSVTLPLRLHVGAQRGGRKGQRCSSQKIKTTSAFEDRLL